MSGYGANKVALHTAWNEYLPLYDLSGTTPGPCIAVPYQLMSSWGLTNLSISCHLRSPKALQKLSKSSPKALQKLSKSFLSFLIYTFMSFQCILVFLTLCICLLLWTEGGCQTDILPRSRVGDRHSPCHAMTASEVRAASIRKNQANLWSPAMRVSLCGHKAGPWLPVRVNCTYPRLPTYYTDKKTCKLGKKAVFKAL